MIALKRAENFLKVASKSDILLALCLIVIVDLVFRFWGGYQQRPFTLGFDVPYRSRIWWAMNDFIAQPKTADLVLLGASDMTCAFYGAEATFLKAPQSQLLKHKSDYLEDKLASSNSPLRTTFCLGIPGEMPSDAYFLTSTLLANKRKPKVICLSIAPRDFYDATFGDPTSTDIFKVASKLGLEQDLQLAKRSSFWDELDYKFQQTSYLYGHKWDLTSWQHHTLHSLLAQLLGESFSDIATPQPIRKLSLIELPEDYGPNEVMEAPFDANHPVWVNNIAEYQSRYRQFKLSTFTQQLGFLKKLAQLCRSEGVGLLIVNSPLTSENRAMIEKSAYDLYISEIPKTVRSEGGVFLNLETTGVFKHEDFFDSIHLNGRGGEKFLAQIALALSKKSELAASTPRFASSEKPY
jgi:hypothetical protein